MISEGKIIVICGPTATGKSALAIQLAKAFEGEIISADSRQVYRGLDVGAAKVTTGEMEGIPHHLIDVADLHETFTASAFQKMAQEKIKDIHSRGKLAIICGGTGMYIAAALGEISFPEIPPNEPLRKELELLSAEELFERLQKTDPERAAAIDSKNKVRLVRAIEVATSPAQPHPIAVGDHPLLQGEGPAHPLSGENLLMIGLTLPKEELVARIAQRIDARIPTLFEEIRKLHDEGVSYERLESFGLEYRHGSEYVQGKISLEEFKNILATRTWQYVRRQMTWFKRDARIHWMNPVTDDKKILEYVQKFLEK